ncbi:trigger factor family protein, partial [Candidatus Parcubacteria bacterium]
MSYKTEQKDNKVIFTITVPAEKVLEEMKKAAKELSENTSIPGFRPGKADYETIKKRLGEMKVLEAATENIIRTAFIDAMLAEDLETVGQPYFEIIKQAPENEMVFTAEVTLMPKIIKLADDNKLSV